MTFKCRAITDEQKAERRESILKSAQHLFQETSYNSLSMAQIAVDAGIAKGTIFLYFETKEELFLALLQQGYQKFFGKINTKLSKYIRSATNCPVEEFVDILRLTFSENPSLLRLIAISSVILEQNIKYSTALNFKLRLKEEFQNMSQLLEQVLPFLHKKEGEQILMQLQALVIGIQHLSEPSSIIKEIISDQRLELFRINFDTLFCTTITAILKGLEARDR